MDFNLCIQGKSEEIELLPYLIEKNIGLELQSYGLKGVSSEKMWNSRLKIHREILNNFEGRTAIHGPFIGIFFTHVDHLLADAVKRRMDITFNMAAELRPEILVLHSGFIESMECFQMEDLWLRETSNFWKEEIKRYEEIGVKVVIENLIEESPSLLIKLYSEIHSKNLGLCLDVGHVNVFSNIPPENWITEMNDALYYIHLHDNFGDTDSHLPVGDGNINFDKIFSRLKEAKREIIISLEVDEETDRIFENLKYVLNRYGN